jgi:hypothetical protein
MPFPVRWTASAVAYEEEPLSAVSVQPIAVPDGAAV